MRPARCKGADCEAEIIYVPSAKSGKAMVLNAKPEKRVLVMALAEAGGKPMLIDGYLTEPDSPQAKALVVSTYVDHHATCPNADSFRRQAGAEEDSH